MIVIMIIIVMITRFCWNNYLYYQRIYAPPFLNELGNRITKWDRWFESNACVNLREIKKFWNTYLATSEFCWIWPLTAKWSKVLNPF